MDHNPIAAAIMNAGEMPHSKSRETEPLETIAGANSLLTTRNIKDSIAGEPTNNSKWKREVPAEDYCPRIPDAERMRGKYL